MQGYIASSVRYSLTSQNVETDIKMVSLEEPDRPGLKCHKVVLATASPLLKRYLQEDPESDTLALDADYATIRKILKYIYDADVIIAKGRAEKELLKSWLKRLEMDDKGTVEKETDSPHKDLTEVQWECPFCQDAIAMYRNKEELVHHLRDHLSKNGMLGIAVDGCIDTVPGVSNLTVKADFLRKIFSQPWDNIPCPTCKQNSLDHEMRVVPHLNVCSDKIIRCIEEMGGTCEPRPMAPPVTPPGRRDLVTVMNTPSSLSSVETMVAPPDTTVSAKKVAQSQSSMAPQVNTSLDTTVSARRDGDSSAYSSASTKPTGSNLDSTAKDKRVGSVLASNRTNDKSYNTAPSSRRESEEASENSALSSKRNGSTVSGKRVASSKSQDATPQQGPPAVVVPFRRENSSTKSSSNSASSSKRIGASLNQSAVSGKKAGECGRRGSQESETSLTCPKCGESQPSKEVLKLHDCESKAERAADGHVRDSRARTKALTESPEKAVVAAPGRSAQVLAQQKSKVAKSMQRKSGTPAPARRQPQTEAFSLSEFINDMDDSSSTASSPVSATTAAQQQAAPVRQELVPARPKPGPKSRKKIPIVADTASVPPSVTASEKSSSARPSAAQGESPPQPSTSAAARPAAGGGSTGRKPGPRSKRPRAPSHEEEPLGKLSRESGSSSNSGSTGADKTEDNSIDVSSDSEEEDLYNEGAATPSEKAASPSETAAAPSENAGNSSSEYNSDYECMECDKKHKTREEYLNHLSTAHGDIW